MKKIILTAGLVLVAFLTISPAIAFADTSITWDQDLNGELYSGDAFGSPSPTCTIGNPHVGITYDVLVTDANSNPIANNGTVANGQTIYLKFTPQTASQIYWFGDGDCQVINYTPPDINNPCGPLGCNVIYNDGSDSPYGNWTQNTSAPPIACTDSNNFVTSTVDTPTVKALYVNLEVSPTTNTISNTTGLSCGTLSGGVEKCTVTANSGTVSPVFNFSATQGSFWPRFEDAQQSLCHPDGAGGTDYSMSYIDESTNPATWVGSYALPIPAQAIQYNLNVTPNQTPPAAPTISCPSSLVTGQTGTFTVSGTDSVGNQIRYGLDWTNNHTVSQWLPASGYVNSGTQESTTHSWSTAGTYTVNADSQDANGLNSTTWGTCQVTVTAQPDLTASLTTAEANMSAYVGQTVNLAATVSNIGAGATGAPFATTFWTNTQQSWTGANAQYTEFTSGVPNGFPGNYSETDGPQLPVTRVFNTAGTYYLQVCADRDQNNNQTVVQPAGAPQNNDCTGWGTITVSACPSGQAWNGSACAPTGGGAASCTLTASPPTISGSQTSTLSWSATNATSCTSSNIPGFTGGINGNVGGIGANQPGNPYQVTCTGSGSPGSCTATVTNSGGGICTPDSTVNLKAASLQESPITFSDGPIRVQAAQNGANNVELQFGSVNIGVSGGACHITRSDTNTTTNFPGNACLVSGTTQNVSVTHSTKFTLACDGVSGTDSVQVNVIPSIQEF